MHTLDAGNVPSFEHFAQHHLHPKTNHQAIPLASGKKKPLHRGWQVRDYSKYPWEAHLKTGGSIGIRLTDSDLVVDVVLRFALHDKLLVNSGRAEVSGSNPAACYHE